MRLKDAIKAILGPRPKHCSNFSIVQKELKITIPLEAIESDGWSIYMENNDPEFAELVKGVSDLLKDEEKKKVLQ